MRAAAVGTLLAGCILAACSGSDAARPDPAVVRVGVLPDQAEDRLRARYEPLIAHLEDSAGIDAELVIPSDFADLLVKFEEREVDLAWFGGLTYLTAERDSDARPLVLRDVDLEFTTDFIVSADAPGETIDDFAGASFAFGPELSTSGHLMPRFHMLEAGYVPEDVFGSVVHSAGHDVTATWVRDGVVDIGAVNSVLFETLVSEGVVTMDRVRILERTRPFRNYVWATQPDLDGDLRVRLLDGFLELDPSDAEDRSTLDRLGAGGYLPATRSDFADLREAADIVGLLEVSGS